jgi:predicted transcriptional regulator
MKVEHEILDVLFPKVRAEILRCFFARSNPHRYVRELMRETGLALSTVQEELTKLTAIGLITSYTNGYHRFYRPNAGHPLANSIRRIVELSKRLPKTKRSALFRKRPGTVSKSRCLQRLHRVRPDRSGVNWQIFRGQYKT